MHNNERFHRVELLMGADGLNAIATKKVIIFGVGGVGSWCAESLVRSGVTDLTIVDFDSVNITNINRQLIATSQTVGRPKVDVLKERLTDINPEAVITTIQKVYTEENHTDFHLEEYDYIIDCIDSLKDKMSLLLRATEHKATVFSSMGAALKIDPTQIKVGEYWKVRGCPLGAAIRKKMKRAKVKPAKPILCVYSEEMRENHGEQIMEQAINGIRQVNGTMAHITAIFGFTLAGLVIKDIAGE